MKKLKLGGTAIQNPPVPNQPTKQEKKRVKKMSKYDKERSDKPTSYFDNPYSTRKNPTDYLKKGGMVKKTVAKKLIVKSKKK
jgi:hypothetical protein